MLFQTLTLEWQGKKYPVPAERIMGAIAVIEEVVTFPELCMMFTGKPKISKLAQAYGELLRYAGVTVSDIDVYNVLFTQGEIKEQVGSAINQLLAIMTPPSALGPDDEAPAEGNRPAASSSANFTRRRSAASGSRVKTSGKPSRLKSSG